MNKIMNDDQILLYTIAEILLEVELSEEHKQRICDALCGIYQLKMTMQST